MSDYPKKDITITALLAAARNAAMDSSAIHPEDIAAAMVVAIDGAAATVQHLSSGGYLIEEAYDDQS